MWEFSQEDDIRCSLCSYSCDKYLFCFCFLSSGFFKPVVVDSHDLQPLYFMRKFVPWKTNYLIYSSCTFFVQLKLCQNREGEREGYV